MSITTLIGTMVVPLGLLAAMGIIYVASRYYGCPR